MQSNEEAPENLQETRFAAQVQSVDQMNNINQTGAQPNMNNEISNPNVLNEFNLSEEEIMFFSSNWMTPQTFDDDWINHPASPLQGMAEQAQQQVISGEMKQNHVPNPSYLSEGMQVFANQSRSHIHKHALMGSLNPSQPAQAWSNRLMAQSSGGAHLHHTTYAASEHDRSESGMHGNVNQHRSHILKHAMIGSNTEHDNRTDSGMNYRTRTHLINQHGSVAMGRSLPGNVHQKPPFLEKPGMPVSTSASGRYYDGDANVMKKRHERMRKERFHAFLPLQVMPRIHERIMKQHVDPIRKQPGVPHSNVEKQRRDRMNSLVDELRLIVPVQTGGMETQDNRRPKHIVLSDAIDYIHAILHDNMELRAKLDRVCECQEMHASAHFGNDGRVPVPDFSNDGRETAHGHGNHYRGHNHHNSQTMTDVNFSAPFISGHSVQNNNDPKSNPEQGEKFSTLEMLADTEIPPMKRSSKQNEPESLAPGENEIADPSISFYNEDEKTILQVTCKDRRGLLGDIAKTLQRLPLHVKGANIVTAVDNTVTDKFEVDLDDNAPHLNELEELFLETFRAVSKEAFILAEKRQRASSS